MNAEHPSAPASESVEIDGADAQYRPIGPFQDWAELTVDTARWDAGEMLVKERGDPSPALLARARDIVKRAAAVETGAIEGLYDTDRGFTFTVAMQSALWEAAASARADQRARLIHAQLAAYDMVLDFATQVMPVAEAWIRDLHRRICEAQVTYRVHTAAGPQEQSLPLGDYKAHPNHVVQQDGTIHSYAPVLDTPTEMQRLCQELRSEAFSNAHPVLQAAYAHYGLVAIHPFADGNGRVARALASVFLYRAAWIPLFVLVAHRSEYFGALAAADSGDHQALVNFVLDRSEDAFRLVSESMRTAAAPVPAAQFERIRQMYTTKGGYTHAEVDTAGAALLGHLSIQFVDQVSAYQIPGNFSLIVGSVSTAFLAPSEGSGYRKPVSVAQQMVRVTAQSAPPADAELVWDYYFWVPRDCGKDNEIRLRCVQREHEVSAPMKQVYPQLTEVVSWQLTMFVERTLGEMLAELAGLSERSLSAQGYG